MGLDSIQVQVYILQGVVHMHSNGHNQIVYKWYMCTVTENNKDKGTIGLPGENNRMFI